MFFSEAITPIEKTHRAALKANVRLSQLQKRLGRRTSGPGCLQPVLETENRAAQDRGASPQEKGGTLQKLLKESLALQKYLQHLTHQILSAQEDKRKEISRDLQDEIAQTLLGIRCPIVDVEKGGCGQRQGPAERDCQHPTAGGYVGQKPGPVRS